MRRERLRFMVMLSVVSCAAFSDGQASETTWDCLPLVGYDNEELAVALRPANGTNDWSLHDDHANEIALRVDQDKHVLSASVSPLHSARLELRKGDERLAVRLVRPGKAVGLALDAQGRLTQEGELVILVLPRIEAEADRRWAILGLLEKPDADPCTVQLTEPTVPWGEPALTIQACASQRLQLDHRGVLLRLSGADRLAGWKHREYRQLVAWLVADCLARGASRVVLVQPCAPAPEAATLAPLCAQVDDVAHAYHCRVLATGSLSKAIYWEVSEGVLGTAHNQRGRSALDDLVRPFLAH